MLIESYNLAVEVSGHSAEEFEYEAIAHVPVDISACLPYLNATLRNGTYFPDGPAFSWQRDNHRIGFWSDRIAVDHLESRDEAKAVVEQLVALVNEVWEKRDKIEPDTTTRQNLQPLELYRLLPKTNCKVCGEHSCFNFALKLAAGQLELKQCRPLYEEPSCEAKREQLESLVATKRTLL